MRYGIFFRLQASYAHVFFLTVWGRLQPRWRAFLRRFRFCFWFWKVFAVYQNGWFLYGYNSLMTLKVKFLCFLQWRTWKVLKVEVVLYTYNHGIEIAMTLTMTIYILYFCCILYIYNYIYIHIFANSNATTNKKERILLSDSAKASAVRSLSPTSSWDVSTLLLLQVDIEGTGCIDWEQFRSFIHNEHVPFLQGAGLRLEDIRI